MQSDLASGLASWEDSQYFRDWEGKIWSKIFFEDSQQISGQESAVKREDSGDIDFVLEDVKTRLAEPQAAQAEEPAESSDQ